MLVGEEDVRMGSKKVEVYSLQSKLWQQGWPEAWPVPFWFWSPWVNSLGTRQVLLSPVGVSRARHRLLCRSSSKDRT